MHVSLSPVTDGWRVEEMEQECSPCKRGEEEAVLVEKGGTGAREVRSADVDT